MIKVYVAGPYTKGDVALNVRRAIEVGDELYNAGFAPFIPHLTHFWHMLFPRPYEQWLSLDNQWVPLCDILLRLKGESSGADKEADLAISNSVPVVYEVEYSSLDVAILSIRALVQRKDY